MDASPSSDSQQTRPTFAYESDSTVEATTPASMSAAGAPASTASIAGAASAELAQRHSAGATPASAASIAGAASAELAQRHSAMPPIPGSETTRPGYAGRPNPRPRPSNEERGVPGELTPARVTQLRNEAFSRARVTQSPERLTAWLVTQGLPQSEAETMAANAWRKAQARRQAAVAQSSSSDNALAALEIIAGFVLLGVGLAAGWFVGLFLVPIVDGFRRLG